MTDDDTTTATRGFSTPDDYDTEHDTPEIDKKRITKTARKVAADHPYSPPEPTPAPETEASGPGEGEQPAPGESDDKTIDYAEDTSAAAGA